MLQGPCHETEILRNQQESVKNGGFAPSVGSRAFHHRVAATTFRGSPRAFVAARAVLRVGLRPAECLDAPKGRNRNQRFAGLYENEARYRASPLREYPDKDYEESHRSRYLRRDRLVTRLLRRWAFAGDLQRWGEQVRMVLPSGKRALSGGL